MAVKDNEVVYSKETEWDVTHEDPDYHFKAIVDALKRHDPGIARKSYHIPL